MPEDYKKVVFDAYKRKKLEGNLSSNLLNPTPGNLRAECLIVCRERYNDKDHEILRLFFDGSKEKGYIKSIENSKAQSLRQMSEILKGADVKNPGAKYFELLAWLIDLNIGTETSYYKRFYDDTAQDSSTNNETKEQARVEINEIEKKPETNEEPDSDEKKISDVGESIDVVYEIEEKQSTEARKFEGTSENDFKAKDTFDINQFDKQGNLINTLTGNNIKDPDGERKTKSQEKEKKTARLSIIFKISISFIILFIIGIAYAFWKKNKDKAIREASPTEQCMYWTGLHYEPIACNDNDANKLKLPLNKEQLANQQKITLPDTLTEKSIGKVWYGRINSITPEFYTDSGMNPLDTVRRLKPLTPYMLNKHVSYDRYQLEVLIWSVSLLALFGVLVGMAYRYRPKIPA